MNIKTKHLATPDGMDHNSGGQDQAQVQVQVRSGQGTQVQAPACKMSLLLLLADGATEYLASLRASGHLCMYCKSILSLTVQVQILERNLELIGSRMGHVSSAEQQERLDVLF